MGKNEAAHPSMRKIQLQHEVHTHKPIHADAENGTSHTHELTVIRMELGPHLSPQDTK